MNQWGFRALSPTCNTSGPGLDKSPCQLLPKTNITTTTARTPAARSERHHNRQVLHKSTNLPTHLSSWLNPKRKTRANAFHLAKALLIWSPPTFKAQDGRTLALALAQESSRLPFNAGHLYTACACNPYHVHRQPSGKMRRHH